MSGLNIQIASAKSQPESLLSRNKWHKDSVLPETAKDYLLPNIDLIVLASEIRPHRYTTPRDSLNIKQITPASLMQSNKTINLSDYQFNGIEEFQNETRIFLNVLFLFKYGLNYKDSPFYELYELMVHLPEDDEDVVKKELTTKSRVERKREFIDRELSKPEYSFTRDYLKKYGKEKNTPIPEEIKEKIRKFGVTYVYFVSCLASNLNPNERNKIDFQANYNAYIATLFDNVFQNNSTKEQENILPNGERYKDTIREVTTQINYTLYTAVRDLGKCDSNDCVYENVSNINQILRDISTFFFPHKIFNESDLLELKGNMARIAPKNFEISIK
ncbi:MAG: hypothetical protein A2Y40_05180 [Candidatus Margulisbacteria bacterium GWF2_35_9]|nr:MAG: hypothetical protein A2Y40_05180 [Candidatus Margulisbacteria bacterium GWF2_35_9]